MKKTLAALIIGAFAASAANAAVVYNNEGTKVELDGSIRLIAEKTNFEGNHKERAANGDVTNVKRHSHTGLRNAGSRFGITVNHDLGDGYYALGRLETRFDGGNKKGAESTDSFGNITAHRVYVGFGHKEFGEVRFGRQLLIADDLSTAKDYSYGIIDKDSYIQTSAKSSIRYDYNGVEGLTLSAGYQFAEKRGNDYEVVSDSYYTNGDLNKASIANGAQLGAVYEANNVIAKFGYGRTNYKSATNQKHHVDGFLASVGYDFSGFIVSLDGGYAKEKEKGETTKRFYVSPGFQYQVTEASKVYGNYKYEQEKANDGAKDKTHGFLLGVDYKLHKQVVTYLEGKYQVTKSYDKDGKYEADSKIKDKAIGVGVRVYF